MTPSSGQLVLALPLVVVACGSRTGLSVPDGGAGAACMADAALVAGGCTSNASGELPADARFATGGITGSTLRVEFCPGGLFASVRRAVYTTPYFFELSTAIASTTPVTAFDFEDPVGGADGILQVLVDLASTDPGVYSSQGEPGQIVSFSYDVPHPCFDCGPDVPVSSPGDCRPGCSTVCAHSGCLPCRPKWPTTTYDARTWELVLNAAPPDEDAGTGSAGITPHGTFTATLVDDSDTSKEASLTASF
jgi:hypothetical protein